MITEQRKQKILDLIKQNNTVKVTELSKLFNVSEVTIRNYLTSMEKKGLLTRTHGGAVNSYKPYYSMNLTQRLESNLSEKLVIAEEVAEFIKPNDTIMINSGTTTLLTFRKIPAEYNLNIVTNSVAIALEASSNPNFNVILIGGSVNTKYQFTFGSDAVRQLREYHADKLILSVDGVDINHGLTTFYDKEVEVDMAMIEHSSCHIIAADYSKFNRSAFAKISDISVADYIVTNAPMDQKQINEFVKHGIKINLC